MDETLKSLDVQIREREKHRLKIRQNKEMKLQLMNNDNRSVNQNNNAFNDTYMKEAYAKVSKSKITHNEDLMRMNGTWLYNKTINPNL
jgi:hypothetical protein